MLLIPQPDQDDARAVPGSPIRRWVPTAAGRIAVAVLLASAAVSGGPALAQPSEDELQVACEAAAKTAGEPEGQEWAALCECLVGQLTASNLSDGMLERFAEDFLTASEALQDTNEALYDRIGDACLV